MQYQTDFFSEPVVVGKKRRKKFPKCPWSVTGQRNSAYYHIKALDKQLIDGTGEGLSKFQGKDDDDTVRNYLYNGIVPPIFTIHLDEGSPAYSMCWFLFYCQMLRGFWMRDPHHRDWNDVKLGISGADLWHIILLMAVVFNMPFGAWDSGSWFSKIKRMAKELGMSLTASNPLFVALYELICADMGIEPEGTPQHREYILKMVLSGPAYTVKGVKVSLRRWFGWFQAASLYLPLWHSRLMALITMGQSLKVYRTYKDVPLWRNVAAKPSFDIVDGDDDGVGDGDDGDAEFHGDAAGDIDAAAAAAGAALDQHRVADEEKGNVKEKPGKEQLKDLRKTTRNTVFLCAEILSRDGVRNQVAMLMELIRPIYTEHSDNARDCRAPKDVCNYYLKAAQCHYMTIIEKCAAVMLKMELLKGMGFETEFGKGLPRGLTAASPQVAAQDHLAFQMVNVWARVAFHRITSMLWHSCTLPGYLVLLTSESYTVFWDAAKRIQDDYRIYLDVLETHCHKSTFINKLIRDSPFKLKIVSEIAHMLTWPVVGLSEFDIRASVTKLATWIFSGWGQTKVCEDLFKTMRERESMDSLNGVRCIEAYYAAMPAMGTIPLHKRREIQFTEDEPEEEVTARQCFASDAHTPSLTDAHRITDKATWPTYTPQSSKTIHTHQELLRHGDKHDSWHELSKCWQCALLPTRTIIYSKIGGCYYIVLGPLCYQMLVVWQVEPFEVRNTGYMVFLLGHGRVMNTTPTLLPILTLDDFTVIPTSPVGPLHYFLTLKRKFPRHKMGVLILQHDKPAAVMLHAARNGFFDMQLPQLKTIANEYGIDTPCLELPLTLTAVVKHMVKLHTKTDITVSELHSILALRSLEECSEIPTICDEDMLIEILDKEDLQAFQENACWWWVWAGGWAK